MIIITLSNLGNYVWYVPSMYSNRIHEHFIKNFFRNFHSFLKSAWMISTVDSLTESRTKDSGVIFGFGSALTLATFVLVIVDAHLNSWDYFFQIFPIFRLGVSISIRVRATVKFQVYHLHLLCFYQSYCIIVECYYHTRGGRIRFQI